MHVTACIVSYNTAAHLPAAIASLRAQTHPDLHLLVVDNNSHDGSAVVAARDGDVEVVANRRNVGYTGAANKAVARARRDGALFLMTPDVRLEPGHVAALVGALSARPTAGSAQGRLHRMTPDGQPVTLDGHPVVDTAGHTAHVNRVFRNRGDGQPDDGRFDQPVEVFGACGAAVLHRVEALHDVAIDGEVFDDDLFAFFEDVDLDWRLKARGWETWYAPAARGQHERGGEGARRSRLVERLSYRNSYLVTAKNDDWAALRGAIGPVAATTALRTADIAATVPSAFLRAIGDARLLRSTMAKRRVAEARRTVPNVDIVDRWFQPFDYAAWIRKRARRGW